MPKLSIRTLIIDFPLDIIGDETWTWHDKVEHAEYLANLAASALSMAEASILRTACYPNRREDDPERHPRIVATWSWARGSDPRHAEAEFVARMAHRLAFLFSYAPVRYWVDDFDPILNTHPEHWEQRLSIA